MDLDNYDQIEDDDHLVVGPMSIRQDRSSVPGSRSGGNSLKDSSILGGGGIASKFAPSISAPAPYASTSGLPRVASGRYAIIATASASSSAPRQPRSSAPGGGSSEHGSLNHEHDAAADRLNGVVDRLAGNILGDDSDDSPQHQHGQVLRAHNGPTPGAVHPPAPGSSKQTPPAYGRTGSQGGNGSASLSRRGSGVNVVPGIFDEAPTASNSRPLLVRNSSMHEIPVVVAVQPKSSGGGGKPPLAAHPCSSNISTNGHSRGAEENHSHPPEVPVKYSSAPQGQLEQEVEGGAEGGNGRGSGGGIRGLFSRGSSGRRKSELGVQPVPGLPQPQHKQRHSEAGREDSSGGNVFGDVLGGPEGGVPAGRPPSGLLKRTASALAAWAR